jgi:hypothetical protein
MTQLLACWPRDPSGSHGQGRTIVFPAINRSNNSELGGAVRRNKKPVGPAAAQMAIVHELAQPIADRARRAHFVAAVAEQLSTTPTPGSGAVYRIARGLQRQYFDPPIDPRIGQSQRRA